MIIYWKGLDITAGVYLFDSCTNVRPIWYDGLKWTLLALWWYISFTNLTVVRDWHIRLVILTGEVARCNPKIYNKKFILSNFSNLLNSLPFFSFPALYDLPIKCKISRHLVPAWNLFFYCPLFAQHVQSFFSSQQTLAS